MSEKNINEKIGDAGRKSEKEERKQGLFAKIKPLAEGAMVGVVSSALILGSCTRFTDFPMPNIRQDAESDTQESDNKTKLENIPRDASEDEAVEIVEDEVSPDDEEAEEDAVEEELADVPEEDAVEDEAVEIVEDEVSPEEEDVAVDPDAEVEEELPADVIEDEVQDATEAEEDATEDVSEVTDVGAEEEISIECNPFDETRTVFIRLNDIATVGNVSIRYDSYSGTTGTYSILCGDGVVREGIVISERSDRSIDVPEQGFSVRLYVNAVSSRASNVTVYVDAY